MARCPRCNKRPAKRHCPALITRICAVCCARDRMIEIRCPESCDYLHQARMTSATRLAELLRSQMRASQVAKLYDNERRIYILSNIDDAIARAQRELFNDLEDSEVVAALDNAIRNLETAGSGLIYEHTQASPRVQQLSVSIRDHIETAAGKVAAEIRPPRAEVVECLRFQRSLVDLFTKNEGDGRAYVRHAAQLLSWPAEETQPRIIA